MKLNFREYYGQEQGPQNLIGWPTKPIYRPDALQLQRLLGIGTASTLFGAPDPALTQFHYYRTASGKIERSPLDVGGKEVPDDIVAKFEADPYLPDKLNADSSHRFTYWWDEHEETWKQQLKKGYQQRYWQGFGQAKAKTRR